MRRRIPYRVCSCMPNGVVTHLEARLLKEIVNREIHPIRCAESCKRKFQKGSRIGDLCAETGHFWWAMRVWKLTGQLIASKDYDDWIDVWFNTERVRLSHVVSEAECELLAHRRSNLWRPLGIPEESWWSERDSSELSYRELLYEKYDFDPFQFDVEWDEFMKSNRKELETESIFREGQVDNLPLCSQDFFEYWGEAQQPEDFYSLDE